MIRHGPSHVGPMPTQPPKAVATGAHRSHIVSPTMMIRRRACIEVLDMTLALRSETVITQLWRRTGLTNTTRRASIPNPVTWALATYYRASVNSLIRLVHLQHTGHTGPCQRSSGRCTVLL